MTPVRPKSRPASRRDEYGGGSMLILGLMVVVMTVTFVAALVAGYLIAAHRVEVAADLAALSGASAYASGRDGCSEARRNAAGNAARLVRCSQVGDQLDFVVSVTAEVEVDALMPGLPTRLRAVAHAGSNGP